jgi:hypothetical protein
MHMKWLSRPSAYLVVLEDILVLESGDVGILIFSPTRLHSRPTLDPASWSLPADMKVFVHCLQDRLVRG